MIAILVGHSRTGDSGAVSVDGTTEWTFNCKVAAEVARRLRMADVDVMVFNKYPRSSYSAAMNWLAAELRKLPVAGVAEIHFNSSDDPKSTGHEWLYWSGSREGKRMAKCLDAEMTTFLPGYKRRGLVAIYQEKQRGGAFLRRTPCPAVICEPFFGSNPKDWQIFGGSAALVAEVIANGLIKWRKGVPA